MKLKSLVVLSLVLLSGCSVLSGLTGQETSATQLTATGKLKACSIEEAGKMVQNGKAFTQGISVSADEISETCIKKLALQSAGLDNQASKDATSALQSLINAASTKK